MTERYSTAYLSACTSTRWLTFLAASLGLAVASAQSELPGERSKADQAAAPTTEKKPDPAVHQPQTTSPESGALPPPRRRWEPPPPPPPATEQDLKHEAIALKRATERWQAIRTGQFEKAYEFISPAGRLVVSKDRHIEILKGLPVLESEPTKALCRQAKCQVTVMQTVEMTVPRVGKKQLRSAAFEQWILDGDQAWLLIRPD